MKEGDLDLNMHNNLTLIYYAFLDKLLQLMPPTPNTLFYFS